MPIVSILSIKNPISRVFLYITLLSQARDLCFQYPLYHRSVFCLQPGGEGLGFSLNSCHWATIHLLSKLLLDKSEETHHF